MAITISIITVCFNSHNLIGKTVQSVISQNYPSIEYILIDGGSTDGTLDVLEKYREHIAVLISEKDDGIYDAMNKGLSHATGDLVYFLNSGDFFYNSTVLKDIEQLSRNREECGIFIGDTFFYASDTTERILGYRKDEIDYIGRVVNHQGIFARRSVFERIGGFDTTYKIYADFDWLLRAILQYTIKVHYTSIPIAYYLKGGISDIKWKKYVSERREILQRYATRWQIFRYFLRYPGDLISYLWFRIYH
jgi:glycosyltransferase involved in cell wall biosynthesis